MIAIVPIAMVITMISGVILGTPTLRLSDVDEYAETLIALSGLPRPLRPLLLLPAFAMVGVIGFRFMEVMKGPTIVRAFAVGALCWLTILLVLGSVDPFTRGPHP